MSDVIHLLPDNIANQIAAGEVIQRPASVVKELVENALDAGATRIQVNVKEAGKALVQVIDNGKGMSETDARMAFERHATSKIARVEDLFTLHTMGFRGEALASIAAVAQVELKTRLRGAECGTCLLIAGSKVESCEPDAWTEGSVFSVKNLFYNVPARRTFLKSNETEFRHIITEFERVALVNPQVSFTLSHNDTEILNLPESGLRQRIININGKAFNQKLLSLEAESSLVKVHGFIARPDTATKRGALQYFFVNGRFMRHPYFHKAVMQAYEQLIAPGEMPSYFIYLTLDPATIDVNIHPTKTEIKFENEQPIWQILLAATRETLAKSSAIPSLDFTADDSLEIPVYNPMKDSERREQPKVHVSTGYNPFNPPSSSADYVYGDRGGGSQTSRPDFDWAQLYENFESEREAARQDAPSAEPPREKPLFDETLMPCYQYKSHYIVTSLKSGLALVDQHRAHIRILYEQYQKRIAEHQGLTQQMLFPAMVEFTPSENNHLPELMDDLTFAGFDLSNLGGGTYSINGIPAGMEGTDCVRLLKEIVSKAIETGGKAHEDICNMVAFSLASAQAIPVGKTLAAEEMDNLVASLFTCSDSNYTPDGKTILTILSNEELEKRFR